MLSSVASSAVYCLGPMRSRLSLGTPRRFSARYQGAANVMCIRITWTSSWIGAGSRWSGWCWRSRRSGPLRQPGTMAGAWSPKRLGELRGWPVATIRTRPLRPPTQRANQGPHVLRCSTRVDGHMQPPLDPTAFWLTSGGNSPRFGKATRCGGDRHATASESRWNGCRCADSFCSRAMHLQNAKTITADLMLSRRAAPDPLECCSRCDSKTNPFRQSGVTP